MHEKGPFTFATGVDNAWLFDASCDGGANSFEIQVHEDFTEADAASAAQKYGKAVGHLPKALRSGIGTATGILILPIHKGSHSWFAGRRSGKIGVYTELAQDKYNEEAMVHEAAHVSLDNRVRSDPKWLAAQKADGKYLSDHARNHPQREDVAESFLAYLSARYVPSRISRTWETTIWQTIPNRIAYFDALLSADDMKPFTRAPRRALVSLSVSSGHVAEAGGTVTITATRSIANTSGKALTIPIAVKTSGTTAQSADYTALATSISIADNATTGTTTFTATADTVDEAPETVVVELVNTRLPTGTIAGTHDEVTITIVDDDPTVVWLSRVGSGEVSEGGVIEFTVRLLRTLIAGETIDVPLSIRGAGVTTADWTLDLKTARTGPSLNTGVKLLNRTTATPKLRFSGAGARLSTLRLYTADDTVDEPTGESYIIALGPDGTATNGFDVTTLDTNVGGGADPGASNTFTVQVHEAADHSVSIGMDTTSANEGAAGATATYGIGLPVTPARSGGFHVHVCVSGSATWITDYELRDSSDHRFSLDTNGCVSGGVSLPLVESVDASPAFHIFVKGDADVETSETVILTVSERASGKNATPPDVEIDSANNRVTFTITNDDATPTIPVITIAPTTANTPVTEGAAASYTLTATPAPVSAVTVNLMVADDADSDFIAAAHEGAKTVMIPTAGTATYTVTTTGDRVYEADGSVTVTVAADDATPATYTVGDPSSASIEVEDDDTSDVSLNAATRSRAEDSGATEAGAELTIAATRALETALTVSYTLGGTATCGTDYTIAGATCDNDGTGTGTITLPSGAAAGEGVPIPIRMVNDHIADNGETIILTLASGSGYGLGNPAATTVTIYQNTGEASYSIQGEPHTGATLTIQRDQSDPEGDGGDPDRSYSWASKAALTDPVWTPVAGETGNNLVVGAGLLHHHLRAEVSYVDGNGLATTVQTASVGPVTEPPPLPVLTIATATPVITEGESALFTVTSNRALPPGESLVIHRSIADTPEAASDFLDETNANVSDDGVWVFSFIASDSGATARRFEIPTVCDTTTEPSGNITVKLRPRSGEYTVVNPATAMVMVNDGGNCGTRTATTPRPAFGAGSIADQTWARGQEIAPLPFPQATGGAGALTYTLTPAPPSGILYDAGAYRLSGIPAQAQTRTQYAWVATDENGATATLPFAITITDVAQLRIQDAVRSALSALVRRSLSSAITNINARFADLNGSGLTLAGYAMPLGGSATPAEWHPCPAYEPGLSYLAGAKAPTHCSIHSRGWRSAELLGSSDFSLMPGASTPSSADAPRWSLWGRGDRGSFAGGESNRYDGKTRTGWLGIDARQGAWVAGLAVSRSEGEASYHTPEDEGDLETTINSVYPYGRWSVSDRLEIRALLGTGDGQLRHTPQGESPSDSALSMRLGSLGLRHSLAPGGRMELALRIDASHSTLKTQDGVGFLHGLTADSWRIRAGIEATRSLALSDNRELSPFLEISMRKDGGDGLRGEGIELAGGARYQRPGLSVEMRGRVLAAHSEKGAKESGLSVTVRGGAGAQGRGLWFELQPNWGAHTGTGALWQDTLPQIESRSNRALDARIGYGLPVSQGLLTPYTGAGWIRGQERSIRLGTRFQSATGLGLELFSEREMEKDGQTWKLTLRHVF